ncbi:triose-phosphate isomerase [Syntrophobacter fumaroxidans]|uniref:Triosephosphate isomerase n=1 Tax=Syntrophobacter fumaroxidans (strain DSM 10017 / MPOB) TaxID=335543 RepID=A0LJZ0_SYNFM|nr:triose-phosphate isomerase [Syntrophobacter fumaroxidans]ABK17742.1 triosephosphate isomerase [Syntrophobacter fumaroxidans MPOB]
MEKRIPLIAANWKMHKTVGESVAFIEELQREVGAVTDREVVIAPPFTALAAVRRVMTAPGYRLASQNCHQEAKGAFTGEVSGGMLKDVGCEYVIVGHSERRHVFGETNETIRLKVAAAFACGLVPILCVGEVLAERESNRTFKVVDEQVQSAVLGLTPQQARELVIAYEPVWAIGTGKTATPDQAQEVHAFIRERYAALCDKTVANLTRILYGGSVKPDNVDSLMAQPDVDGLLVGGASLEVGSFKRIIRFVSP